MIKLNDKLEKYKWSILLATIVVFLIGKAANVQKSKELGKIIFLFLFVLFFAWYIYAFARMTMNGLAMLHIEYVIIGELILDPQH